MTQNPAPIALFVYNRPRHTLQTLLALNSCALSDKSTLYIFADGVKKSSDNSELSAVSQTRDIIKSQIWCGETVIREAKVNKGLANSIIDGITEVVQQYGKVIVLEDDIVVSPYFLRYMNDALDFYENRKGVFHISGYAHPFYKNADADTFFSKYMSCWGWATWADRWKHFRKEPKATLKKIGLRGKRDFTYGNNFKFYYQIKANITGKRNTWAVFWYAAIWLNGGLCLNPKNSFVRNIGMDGSGDHCGVSKIYDTELCRHYPIKFESEIHEKSQTREMYMKKTNKKKTLVCIRPSGQSSNRLFQNLHFEAFCNEHGIEYRNPTFADMAALYTSPCGVESSAFIDILRVRLLGKRAFRHSRIANKIFLPAWWLSKLGLVRYLDFDRKTRAIDCEKNLLAAFEKNNIVFTVGWHFRVPMLLEKHRNEMVQKYSLKPSFYENNELYKKIIKLKQEENVLTGVHIRRGDYKEWQGGKYYFEDDVYEKYMQNFSRKLTEKSAKNQIFIIFSNDNVKFKENENLLISKEKWYIDHHIMSLCDYLIGPISTFSLWANYMGRNKLFHIQDNSGNIDNAVKLGAQK